MFRDMYATPESRRASIRALLLFAPAFVFAGLGNSWFGIPDSIAFGISFVYLLAVATYVIRTAPDDLD